MLWQRTEPTDWISIEKIKDTFIHTTYVLIEMTIVFFAICHIYQQYAEPYTPLMNSWIEDFTPASIRPYVWGEEAIWNVARAKRKHEYVKIL